MHTSIFLSYRREDSLAQARAVYERLRTEFGNGRVFIDLEGLQGGYDFEVALKRHLDNCHVFIALIGRNWLGNKAGSAARRIDDANDFVRAEVRSALDRSIRVIPLLLDGADMPPAHQLPDDLKPFARRQAMCLDFRRFDADARQLVISLRAQLPTDLPVSARSALVGTRSSASNPTAQARSHGLHKANVNALEECGPALKQAIVSRLPGAAGVLVVRTATINLGEGVDRVTKYQYQITFVNEPAVSMHEFKRLVDPLIVELNSYEAPGNA